MVNSQEVLQKMGLSLKEIEVYLRLLQLGPNRASTLAYQMKLPRTTVQNILNRLEQDDIVSTSHEKNVTIYIPAHPEELEDLIEVRRHRQNYELDQASKELQLVLPQMIGMMRSNKHVPRVHFYRGLEGVRKVLFDTLKSKTELKDFANIDAMFKHVKDTNDDYVKAREKSNVTKRSLLLDTPFAREVYESGKYSPKSHKGYKWIPSNLYPFSLEMNIYDGKVSYLTYVENDLIGVIIENDTIYEMHHSMWNLLWDTLPAPKLSR